MATQQFAIQYGNGAFTLNKAGNLSALLPSQTALDDAMTTLQADGASPTEAHVDDADAAWIAYKAALATAQSDASFNMVLTFNDSALDTVDKRVKALNAIKKAMGLPGA